MALVNFDPDLIPGIDNEAVRRYVGLKRRGSLKQVLDKCVDLANWPEWQHTAPVPVIARACKLSERTVGRKLMVLEGAGLISRKLMGPAPPIMYVHPERLMSEAQRHQVIQEEREKAKALARRKAAEARARELHKSMGFPPWCSGTLDITPAGAKARETLEGEPPSSAGDIKPEPEAELCEETVGTAGEELGPEVLEETGSAPLPAAKSLKAALKSGGKSTGTTSALASLLWNAEPWRPDEAEKLDKAANWPQPVLDLPPSEVAKTIHYYCGMCHTGSERWSPGPVTHRGFIKHFSTLRQWLSSETMGEPSLGRSYHQNDQDRDTWRNYQPGAPDRDPSHPRAQLLARWLRKHYDSSGEFASKLQETLSQSGAPPDWLPERLRGDWGCLKVFQIPH